MSLNARRGVAAIEMLVADLFWGFGFIATVWILRETGAAQLTFLRFLLAALVLVPVALTSAGRGWIVKYARPALWPATLLSLLLIMQSWGLMYTTATKSGFITALYVVFVPLLEAFFNKHRVPQFIWMCVLLSLVGMALIVNLGLESLNVGDAITAVSAIFASFQILAIGKLTKSIEKPLIFNCVQAAWGALICFPFMYLPGQTVVSLAQILAWPTQSLIGLFCLGFGSTVIAFALQLRAQARLTATVASLLFLLESPIALIFAMILLDEHLTASEFIGALLIFTSAVAAVVR